MLSHIKREPALIVGLVQAVIVLGVSFGLSLSIDQTAAILSVTAIVLSIVTRQTVTPVAFPKVPPTLLVLLAMLALGGCTRQQAQQACSPAVEASATLLLLGCEKAYQGAATADDVAALDLFCLPLVTAAEQLERPPVMRALCGAG